VRQVTREVRPAVVSRHEGREFEPPKLFLLATRAPGEAQELDTVVEESRAILSGFAGEELVNVSCEASGTMTVDADESRVVLDLACPTGSTRLPTSWPALGTITLRAESVACHSTAAPGTRRCEMRARWVSAGHVHEARIEATWMRIPGNRVRLHATTGLDELDPPATRFATWTREEPRKGWLAFDLTLEVRD
jgi:hypothetical protein